MVGLGQNVLHSVWLQSARGKYMGAAEHCSGSACTDAHALYEDFRAVHNHYRLPYIPGLAAKTMCANTFCLLILPTAKTKIKSMLHQSSR